MDITIIIPDWCIGVAIGLIAAATVEGVLRTTLIVMDRVIARLKKLKERNDG